MCGISAIAGQGWSLAQLQAMVEAQHHRGPDDNGIYVSPCNTVGLGHNRLSIIDLSAAGHQPMADCSGQVHIVFNGEIYNYLELKTELSEYPYRSNSDTEVILAAYNRWGKGCLDRLLGVFALVIWDERTQNLFAARDRFGVKPLYYAQASEGSLLLSSEIKALHVAGIPRIPNAATWSTYLAYGAYDHSPETFWQGIRQLPAGHQLEWQDGQITIRQWYDLTLRAAETDTRPLEDVQDEYLALLEDSIRIRFRSDVPIAVNLSGGLDSSMLLGLIHRVEGPNSTVRAFTFITNDENYDETPWVDQLLAQTQHESVKCVLRAEDVPGLAQSVMAVQDEPYGGIPTLAYAQIFETARRMGTIVLLDGQGMDEQWAGYDYYVKHGDSKGSTALQGTTDRPVRPECLSPDFRSTAIPPQYREPFPDRVRNLQYRDICHTKIPRTLRFNDRVSMRSSTELREPFLDHRLVELALRQPEARKISGSTQKKFLRDLASAYLPTQLAGAPKRPVQTPQREWLKGPLRDWAESQLDAAINHSDDWLQKDQVSSEWQKFQQGQSDNSFYVWQWISLGMMAQAGQLA